MKKIILVIVFGTLIFTFIGTAKADTFELNLFDLGCPGAFDHNSQSWSSEFDLGITFTEITNVYIDWSGEITAGLAVYDYDPCNPFPLDVAITAYLDMPIHAGTSVWGGEDTYPIPELFERQSDFTLWGTWSGLLDGQATIWLYYETLGIVDGHYIKSGSIALDRANLVVEGTVPEPSSLFLIFSGGLWIIHRSQRIKSN